MNVRHKVNSVEEIIAKAKEYADSGDKWDFKEQGISENFTRLHVKLENGKGEEIFIYLDNLGGNPQDKANNSEKLIDEMFKLFPVQNFPNKKKDSKGEVVTWRSSTYRGALGLDAIKQEISKYYHKHQVQIKQTPNFADWIEVAEVPWRRKTYKYVFHTYLGKSRQTPREKHYFDVLETPLYRDTDLILATRKEYLKEMEGLDYRQIALKIKAELEKHWNNLINDKAYLSSEKNFVNDELINNTKENKQEQQVEKSISCPKKLARSYFNPLFYLFPISLLLALIGLIIYFRKARDD